MKGYTAIGTMFTNNVTPEFKRGILLGVCRSLRAGNNNTCVVYAREIDDEILHSDRNGLQPNHSKVLRWVTEGGVSRALKANKIDVCAVYAREIDDEIHIRVQQGQLWRDQEPPSKDGV